MDQLFQEIPTTLSSERLTLRCPKPGDGAAMNVAIAASFAELQPWLPWAAKLPTPQESEINVCETQLRFMARDTLEFLMFLPNETTCIGRVGFVKIDWRVPSFELGYWLRTSYSGRGYMTEAVTRLTAYAFDDLNAARVFIRCDSRNEASAAVARRAGFRYEGTLRCHHCDYITDQLADMMIFAQV